MTELKTGEEQSNFVFTGTMDANSPIEKGAALRLKIPGTFKIDNSDRVASTCTGISGFSDEISCIFESVAVDQTQSSYLIVSGGFDSKQFTGTDFSFSIKEIKNPYTTEVTDFFDMGITDKNGGLMYTSKNQPTIQCEASDFAYIHVEPLDASSGISTTYTVTITLSVETPRSAYLHFEPPSDVVFQDHSGGFIC